MELELHPLCTLFPRLEGTEFDALKADIKTNGQLQPIVIHDGKILDGGNRYRACIELGISPLIAERDPSSEFGVVPGAARLCRVGSFRSN
ncbi:ParB N-terminal domain-containing protein [Paraburkholderia sp. FT54]|uniref:ParB N-terminal domain-containing protein n=1 Tax=Paraburkholderia sp. FT54 TaxID=3074437 RepID=UPI002877F3B8|nr:ParB N-terminal domain-containing protein [Paraburkholderia sp. FT54]WNC88817.1 ParB N-terminal domain-containing protein [Paraburkholderia sp. FT54]